MTTGYLQAMAYCSSFVSLHELGSILQSFVSQDSITHRMFLHFAVDSCYDFVPLLLLYLLDEMMALPVVISRS